MLELCQRVGRRLEAVHPVGVVVRTIDAGRRSERLEEAVPVGIQLVFGQIVVNTIGLTGQDGIAIDIGQVAGRINRLGRILVQVSAGDTGLILVVDIHTLGVQVEHQVVVQERGGQVERCGNTLHL